VIQNAPMEPIYVRINESVAGNDAEQS